MATYKARALDLLDSLESGYLRRIEECRREIAASEEYLRAHPEWFDRPDARSGAYSWEDSLRLAERNLERVRRAREIARGLSENHPALYTSDVSGAGSESSLISRLLLRKGLPFDVEIPNEATRRALKDAEEGQDLTRYQSLDDFAESMMGR